MRFKALVLTGLGCLVAAVALAIAAGSASADPAVQFRFSFSDQSTFPAGTMCDFNFQDTFTVDVSGTYVPGNNENPVHLTEYVTHNNLDTGYSLSEVDNINNVGGPGSVMTVGIFWHLRDASGNNVLVRAGAATFDATTGQLIRFTPNSAQDQTIAQVICPALGGHAV